MAGFTCCAFLFVQVSALIEFRGIYQWNDAGKKNQTDRGTAQTTTQPDRCDGECTGPA